jgi:PTH1 family peptidyl-tRNA hydrolase
MTDHLHVIACLGNPEPEYANTRHNLGFRVADELAARHDIPLTRQRFGAIIGRGRISDKQAQIVKPQTFMNDSGDPIGRIVHYFRITAPYLMVVYDDMALPLGTLRIRRGGSAGGHRGIKSVLSVLATEHVQRVRLGISAPPDYMTPTDWVLSQFRDDELGVVEQAVARAADALECWLEQGIEKSMNRFNA